jgi:hypothetical protein
VSGCCLPFSPPSFSHCLPTSRVFEISGAVTDWNAPFQFKTLYDLVFRCHWSLSYFAVGIESVHASGCNADWPFSCFFVACMSRIRCKLLPVRFPGRMIVFLKLCHSSFLKFAKLVNLTRSYIMVAHSKAAVLDRPSFWQLVPTFFWCAPSSHAASRRGIPDNDSI